MTILSMEQRSVQRRRWSGIPVALAVTAARVVLLAVIAFGLVATAWPLGRAGVYSVFLVPQLDWFWGGEVAAALRVLPRSRGLCVAFGSLINFLTRSRPLHGRPAAGRWLHLIFLLFAFTMAAEGAAVDELALSGRQASPGCRGLGITTNDH